MTEQATGRAWLSVRTAARRLGLTERRVWALVSAQRLPSVLIGGHRLIDPAAVAELGNKKSTEVQSKLQSWCLYSEVKELRRKVDFLMKKDSEVSSGR